MGRKYAAALAKIEARPYRLEAALALLREIAYARFDETVELALRLGVDPRKPEQQVRGSVVLPHGTGKTRRVLAIAVGDKAVEARQAGADFVEGPEVVERIEQGWLDYEAVVATPDMMRFLGRVGKILGPRGLMPNPKAGTVTSDIGRAIREIKAGRVEFRTDKTGNVHIPVGKKSFPVESLTENVLAAVEAVLRAKPPTTRGRYLRRAYVSTTMSPALELDLNDLLARLRV